LVIGFSPRLKYSLYFSLQDQRSVPVESILFCAFRYARPTVLFFDLVFFILQPQRLGGIEIMLFASGGRLGLPPDWVMS
jgi:hypothetical protein